MNKRLPDRLVGKYNWHHRKPKVRGGSGDKSSPNMVCVSIEQHRAYHTLFGTMSVPEIVDVLNNIWIDPEWEIHAFLKGGK